MAGNLLRFFRKNSTEEEIKQLVDDDEGVGELESSQRQMINNIFLFDDINAGDIMTHRTDIEAIEDDLSISDVVAFAMKVGFSRIPVYHEDLDDIVGILYVKDLLKFVGTKISNEENIKDYIRKPIFVPETISCGKLFTQMTETRIQLAVVVDEYGGTAGIVTMEDVVESIVGNIQDEYDDEDEDVEMIDEKTYNLDGSTDIEVAQKILGTEFPEGDYDTIAGFLINLLGYLPTGDEENVVEVQYENIKFTVLKVEDRRIELIKAEID